MEMQEQLNQLTTENKMYQDYLHAMNAEKIALDQLLVENIKLLLQARKEAILNVDKTKKLQEELEVVKKEKEVLEKQLNDLQANGI